MDKVCYNLFYFPLFKYINIKFNMQQNRFRSYFSLKTVFFIVGLLILTESHYIKKVIHPASKITGYANQTQQFFIPFKKCFKIVPQLQANQQYMTFKPSSLQLFKQSEYLLGQSQNFSLLQTLRSPLTYKHKGMSILQKDNTIMIFSVPNKILVIKQEEKSFKLVDQYRVQEIRNVSTPFKLYKFSADRSIMIVQNHRSFYILDNKGYQSYTLPVDITFAHLQNLQGDDILIAEFNKGLGHYRLNHQQKSIDLIKRYTKQDLKLQQSYIVDVNTNFVNSGEIYLLDAKAGLIKIHYDKQTKQLSNPQIIVHQSNCEAFDTVQNDYFVLLCQIQGYSSIIEISKTTFKNKTVYERMEPTYFSTFFSDIQVSNKFYMIFSNKLINVFWNAKKNRIPEQLDTQSQISIPGLETFKLNKINNNKEHKMYLYAVQSGKLVKYLVQQSAPKLTFRSPQSLYKNMTIYMYGSCEEIGQNQVLSIGDQNSPQNEGILTCQVKQELMLNFQEQFYDKTQDFSISASIIILLILIFLVVIWICLKKYKGLQKQARKVLQVYKKKKGNQHRAI